MVIKKGIKFGNDYIAEDDIVDISLNYISNTTFYANLSKYLKHDKLTGRIYNISDGFDGDDAIQLDLSKQYKSLIISIPYSYIKAIKRVEEPTCQTL